MEQAELFLVFTEPLDRSGFDYMATGSVASILYGVPRLTHDLDLVMVLPSQRVVELANCFPGERYYCPPLETLRVEAGRRQRGHFNLIHHETGYKADIYLFGQDPLHRWALGQRRRIPLPDDKALWVAPPEYVILRKLEYFREGGSEKHIEDIRGMLALSSDQIDLEVLSDWLKTRGTDSIWQEYFSD